MARSVAVLPPGPRVTFYISLGVTAKFLPLSRVNALLAATNRASLRRRDLPAPVVMYYVIALALYMGSSYEKCCAVCWKTCRGCLVLPSGSRPPASPDLSGAHAPGLEVVRQLHDEVEQPMADPATKGAWYSRL